MTTRTKIETVTFNHPFSVSGIDGLQQAGTYTVETDEEPLPTWSPGYRRVATWIRLPGPQGDAVSTQVVMIDPEELTTKLATDAEAKTLKTVLSPGSHWRPEPHRPSQPIGRTVPVAMNAFTYWCALNGNELAWTGLLASLAAVAAFFAEA